MARSSTYASVPGGAIELANNGWPSAAREPSMAAAAAEDLRKSRRVVDMARVGSGLSLRVRRGTCACQPGRTAFRSNFAGGKSVAGALLFRAGIPERETMPHRILV